MSLLGDVEELKRPGVEITVSGASFGLKFVPPVGATINPVGGGSYTVNAVDITLAEGSDPAQVTVTVS